MSGYLVQGGVTPDDSVSTAKIQDDAVTLAKLAAGTDGNLISYDSSGNPVAIATGSDGEVLTSAGAGQPPAFEAASATAPTESYFRAYNSSAWAYTSGVTKLTFDSLEINTIGSQYDTSTSKFTPVAGTYIITFQLKFSQGTFDLQSGTGSWSLYLKKDGANIAFSHLFFHATSTGKSLFLWAITEASGTNYFEVYTYISASTNLTTDYIVANTNFSAVRIK